MRLFLCFLGLLLSSCVASNPSNDPSPSPASASASEVSSTPPSTRSFSNPLPRSNERTILKPFGIQVSPTDSPVSPEKFSGYHTGLDFEIFPEETETDVPVFAICDGTIREKRNVTGYGGVVIQECTVNNETVTVLYGHLRLPSIGKSAKEMLASGETIGMLGTGFTVETGGERKHLHLAVHRGMAIELRGYVQNHDALSAWIDPMTLLR